MELNAEQWAVIRQVGYANLAVLAKLDLPAVLERHADGILRVLFRAYYSRGAVSSRAKAIVDDMGRRLRGESTGSKARDNYLDELCTLYDGKPPSWNTVSRRCREAT